MHRATATMRFIIPRASICLPSTDNRKYLGTFSTCKEAVKEAKKTYKKSNGCKTCSNECQLARNFKDPFKFCHFIKN